MMRRRLSGFTLIDLAIAVGIVGILAAISITIYSRYTIRAQASDIVVKYDAARSTTGANIAGDTFVESCDEIIKRYGSGSIDSKHASITYGFEAVSVNGQNGYRPVMKVCAQSDKQGAQAVKVVRAAHDELAKNARIEGGAVLSDAIASFALPLTAADRLVCKVAPTISSPDCGSAAASPALQKAITQPPAAQPPATVQQAVQPQPVAQGPVCQDTFLGDCTVDFYGMCDMDFVQESCQKTCGLCAAAPVPSGGGGGGGGGGVLATLLPPPGTIPGNGQPNIKIPPGRGWVASIGPQAVLPAVVANDPNTGRWFSTDSGMPGVVADGPLKGAQFGNSWVFNMGDPNCGTNGYLLMERPPTSSGDPQTVTAPCRDGSSKTIPFVRQ